MSLQNLDPTVFAQNPLFFGNELGKLISKNSTNSELIRHSNLNNICFAGILPKFEKFILGFKRPLSTNCKFILGIPINGLLDDSYICLDKSTDFFIDIHINAVNTIYKNVISVIKEVKKTIESSNNLSKSSYIKKPYNSVAVKRTHNGFRY